jgi:threonine aldolase
MAYERLHNLKVVLLGDADCLFTLEDLQAVRDPISTVLIELPQREIGGQLPAWEDLQAICDEARRKGAKLHLDGARLWECAPFYNRSYAEIAAPFDSVYVSFYKILGGLPGAALAGPQSLIDEAKIWQRRQGGNLQQQSPAVITAKLGMEKHLPRIGDYVAKAQEIAAILRGFDRIRLVPEHPPTNMMHVYFQGDRDQLVDASLQIAEEDHTGLFFRLSDQGKFELVIGDAALDLPSTEIQSVFHKLFSRAGIS